MKFKVETGEFYGSVELDPSINSPSEIYFNQDIFYNKGYKFSAIATGFDFKFNSDEKNYLKVYSSSQSNQKQIA